MDSAGSDELGGGFGGDTPAAVLADLASVLDRAQALSGGDLWDHETRDLVAGLEVGCRRLDAARVTVLGHVQRSGLYQVDGHASAKVLVRHACRLSAASADPDAKGPATEHVIVCRRVGCPPPCAKPTTPTPPPAAAPPNPATASPSAADTTAGNRRTTPPNETPTPAGGAPTAPTAVRSNEGRSNDLSSDRAAHAAGSSPTRSWEWRAPPPATGSACTRPRAGP